MSVRRPGQPLSERDILRIHGSSTTNAEERAASQEMLLLLPMLAALLSSSVYRVRLESDIITFLCVVFVCVRLFVCVCVHVPAV